jgi:hypothetical protein
MHTLRLVAVITVLLFASIGVLFTSVFVAMQFGWLNVRGSIEERNDSIFSVGEITEKAFSLPNSKSASAIVSSTLPEDPCTEDNPKCKWDSTREWSVVSGGLTKDLDIIQQVSKETGVSPRLIAAVVVPEQIRFFTSNREVFKRYFEPLKILGSLSKFSLGVSGIKQDTAIAIERHAANQHSEFYPGDIYASLILYDSDMNHDDTLYNRLTNEKDHYYSYLYTAIFIKEILMQWERAGYDITDQPEIVATIFNLGFDGSQPKINPQAGGTTITVGGTNYSFGALARLFYQSDQLPSLQ